MKVLLPKISGFCPGVKKAEKIVFQIKDKYVTKPLYVLGYMINNKKYIKYLKNNNVFTVENRQKLKPGSLLFLRTHGIDKNIEKDLKKYYSVIDLTCNHVKKVQQSLQSFSEKGYFIILNGKKNHPEMLGLKSYAHDYYIIETEQELCFFLDNYKNIIPRNYKKLYITSQTTGSKILYKAIIKRVNSSLAHIYSIEYKNSICPVTTRKEKEALELQKAAEVSIVIGDRMSANANKLYRILCAKNDKVFFVEDLTELKKHEPALKKYKSVMIVSSASTPCFIEKEIIDYVGSL